MKEKFNLKYLLFIAWIIIAVATSFVAFNGKSPKENKVVPRIYTGKYKGHIADKYPEANAKGDKVRKEILANIKTKKVHIEKNHRITECFDSKNRLIYKIDANLTQRTVTMSGNKFHKKAIELDVPEEEGYIYDNDDKVIMRLHRPNLWTYSVDKESDAGNYTYLEQGGIGVLVTDIKYFENNRRVETEEYINRVMSQLYTRTEQEFIDDKLVSEKEFVDQELDDSFIMYSTEKKYNEKGELIHKTVERKDKTNDYKSFTEMDFAKDEIVTKYYKGKNVFATVTENLVGPVKTIEETEMNRGKEIKKVYKNKVKAIVKRQKVGEPIKIVDIIEYVPKEKFDYEKYNIYFNLINTRYFYGENNQLLSKIVFYRNKLPYLDLGVIDKDENYYNYESYYTAENNDFYTCNATITQISEVVEIVGDKLKIKEYELPTGQYDKFRKDYYNIRKIINSGDTSLLKDLKLNFKEKTVNKKDYENLIK